MRYSVKLLVLVLLLAAAVCVYLLKFLGKGHANVLPGSETQPPKKSVVQAPSRPPGTSSPTVLHTSVTSKPITGAITKQLYCRSHVATELFNQIMNGCYYNFVLVAAVTT